MRCGPPCVCVGCSTHWDTSLCAAHVRWAICCVRTEAVAQHPCVGTVVVVFKAEAQIALCVHRSRTKSETKPTQSQAERFPELLHLLCTNIWSRANRKHEKRGKSIRPGHLFLLLLWLFGAACRSHLLHLAELQAGCLVSCCEDRRQKTFNTERRLTRRMCKNSWW